MITVMNSINDKIHQHSMETQNFSSVVKASIIRYQLLRISNCRIYQNYENFRPLLVRSVSRVTFISSSLFIELIWTFDLNKF